MTDMTVTNQTNNDYWFGPLHLPAGINQTLIVDVTTNTSLYLTDDAVADSLNNLVASAKITVTNPPSPFPRATGIPQILHGDGSPDGRIYAPQGSAYLRRDNTGATSSLYVKTTGINVSTGWQAISTETIAVPTGIIQMWAGPSAPTSDWLICDGTAVSRTVYSALFAVTSTLYGSGDGSTTFNLPDLRGRVAVGYAASGGHSDVSTLGNYDGVAVAYRRPKHRHTTHSHAQQDGLSFPTVLTTTHTFANGIDAVVYDNYHEYTSTATADGGSNNANDSLDAPAYLVVNHIIKT